METVDTVGIASAGIILLLALMLIIKTKAFVSTGEETKQASDDEDRVKLILFKESLIKQHPSLESWFPREARDIKDTEDTVDTVDTQDAVDFQVSRNIDKVSHSGVYGHAPRRGSWGNIEDNGNIESRKSNNNPLTPPLTPPIVAPVNRYNRIEIVPPHMYPLVPPPTSRTSKPTPSFIQTPPLPPRPTFIQGEGQK